MTLKERAAGTHYLGSMREGQVRILKEGPSEGHSPAGEHRRKDKSGHRKGERAIGTHVLVNIEKGTNENTE